MHVHVDEPRHDVHPGRIDLLHAAGRAPALIDRDLRHADPDDVDDLVPLDDDVDRTSRRTTGAVDQRGAANDESLKRSLALARPPSRRGPWILSRFGRRSRPRLLCDSAGRGEAQ